MPTAPSEEQSSDHTFTKDSFDVGGEYKMDDRRNWDRDIGAKWLGRVGSVAFVLGIVFFAWQPKLESSIRPVESLQVPPVELHYSPADSASHAAKDTNGRDGSPPASGSRVRSSTSTRLTGSSPIALQLTRRCEASSWR
jgi:hypothetical protein